jgi:outer membrane protein assembly factor BamA
MPTERNAAPARAVMVALGMALLLCGAAADARADQADATEAAAEAMADTAFADDGFEPLPDDEEWIPPIDARGSVRLLPYLHFNRVDEWTPGIRFGYVPTLGWLPRFDIKVAFALDGSDRSMYALELAQPFLSDRRASAGFTLSRFTDSNDEWRVGSLENTLAAVLDRYDYRDYYERDGIAWFLESQPIDGVSATVRYESHRHVDLSDPDPEAWSVLRQESAWRPNPPIQEGLLRAVSAEARYTLGTPQMGHSGAGVGLAVESAGRDLDGDFVFTRWTSEARGAVKPLKRLSIAGRMRAGTTGAGTLPPQRTFAVGGISTLRAHALKTHAGDHMFLANAEVGYIVWRGRQRTLVKNDVQALAFLDTGDAWAGSSFDLSKRQFLTDAGLGVALGEGRLRLYAAVDLRDTDAPVHWTLRLSRPF